MIKLAPIYAVSIMVACAAGNCFGQFIITQKNTNGLYPAREKAACLVGEGLYDGTAPPTGGISAFNLIAGTKELLTVHSDYTAGDMRASYVRRDEWLSALLKASRRR